MKREDEYFECEIIGCRRQAPDVHLRANPLKPKEALWMCDACTTDKQEIADRKKKREGERYDRDSSESKDRTSRR